MDGKYNFEEFYQNLEDGYQIYFTYVRNRYLLFKTSENCYTQNYYQSMRKIHNQDIVCLPLKE